MARLVHQLWKPFVIQVTGAPNRLAAASPKKNQFRAPVGNNTKFALPSA